VKRLSFIAAGIVSNLQGTCPLVSFVLKHDGEQTIRVDNSTHFEPPDSSCGDLNDGDYVGVASYRPVGDGWAADNIVFLQ